MHNYARMLVGVSLFGLAVSHAGAAFAQSADDADNEVQERIIVTGTRVNPLVVEAATGSRLNLTPLETPATVNVLDGDTIRARGDFGFIDAVTRAPGVTPSQTPGDGNTGLAVRGFNGQGSILQLFNGIRLLPVAGSITFPFDTWSVERIEVLNGPGSVLYGQGALGGVVNVIPKAANFEQFEGEGRISYGSFDTVNVAAGVGGPIADTLAFRADGSYRRSDGYVDRGDSEQIALSGSLEYRPADNFSLTLRHDFGDNNPMRYWGTPLVDGVLDTSLRKKNYNVADAVIDFRDNRTQISLDWSPAEGVRILNTAYRLASLRRWENLESYSFDTAAGVVRRDDNLGIVHDVEQWGNQASISHSGQLAEGVTNQLVMGFDFSHVDVDFSRNSYTSDPANAVVDPYDFDPGWFFDQNVRPFYRTATQTYAFYVEDRIEFDEKFSILGGVRYERNRVGRWNYAYDATGNIIGETPALNAGRSAYKDFNDVTWRVGALYQPTPNLSLYAQYVTGVDPVGTLTTYATGAEQFEFSNAKGDQIEAGVKSVFLDGKGFATLSVFRIVKNDLTFQRTINGEIEQVGQQTSQGIEAMVEFQLPAGFAVEANGTVLDAEYKDFVSGGVDFSGNTPTSVPQTAGNLSLSWSALDRFQLRGSLRYVGKRYTNNANTQSIPSYMVVDAGASVALTDNFAIDLRVDNVFDKDYAIDTYGSQQWILGRPRSYEIALRTSF